MKPTKLDVTADEMIETLRTSFEASIKEADQWHPIAEYILALIKYARHQERKEVDQELRDYWEDAKRLGLQQSRLSRLYEAGIRCQECGELARSEYRVEYLLTQPLHKIRDLMYPEKAEERRMSGWPPHIDDCRWEGNIDADGHINLVGDGFNVAVIYANGTWVTYGREGAGGENDSEDTEVDKKTWISKAKRNVEEACLRQSFVKNTRRVVPYTVGDAIGLKKQEDM